MILLCLVLGFTTIQTQITAPAFIEPTSTLNLYQASDQLPFSKSKVGWYMTCADWSGALLEVSPAPDTLTMIDGFPRFKADWQRTKKVLKLHAFQLFRLGAGEKFLVYAGPDVGLGYARDEINFDIEYSFPSY